MGARPHSSQPDFYVGAAQLLHAALGDQLAQDIRTLANTNALLAARATGDEPQARDGSPPDPFRDAVRADAAEPVRPVPYIFIAPQNPSAIGEIARRVYLKHYRRPWNGGYGRDLWLLGQIVDGGADLDHAARA